MGLSWAVPHTFPSRPGSKRGCPRTVGSSRQRWKRKGNSHRIRIVAGVVHARNLTMFKVCPRTVKKQGKIAKMVPKLFTRGQVHPRTFKRVNMVPQLCFLAQTCPCADVVPQGAMRWMWNVHFAFLCCSSLLVPFLLFFCFLHSEVSCTYMCSASIVCAQHLILCFQ